MVSRGAPHKNSRLNDGPLGTASSFIITRCLQSSGSVCQSSSIESGTIILDCESVLIRSSFPNLLITDFATQTRSTSIAEVVAVTSVASYPTTTIFDGSANTSATSSVSTSGTAPILQVTNKAQMALVLLFASCLLIL